MWEKEKNARSGMNCGFWGQGQTEPPSAFLEATKEPVQKEEAVCVSFISSETQWHGLQSPFWHLGNKQHYFVIPGPLPVMVHLAPLPVMAGGDQEG